MRKRKRVINRIIVLLVIAFILYFGLAVHKTLKTTFKQINNEVKVNEFS